MWAEGVSIGWRTYMYRGDMSSGRSLSSFPLPENSKRKVLVGCSGSVAAVKVPKLVQLLEAAGFSVAVVTTNNATKFFRAEDIANSVPIFTDEEEWKMWQKMMDPVLHIELRRWADVLVVAPLDANTLAKAASGICDNLLTCVMRAWDCKKPLLFCPAMNTFMWDHPITAPQIDLLKSWGYTEVPCIKKKLACGDEGLGAMAEVETILAAVKSSLTDELKSGSDR